MIATRTFNELTVPSLVAHIDTGRAPGSPAVRVIRQPVTAAKMENTMVESEESLIADVRGNWTPREMVERRLMALSYTCRPGPFSHTYGGRGTTPRPR
jgi:hypothetical protein